MRSLSLPPRPSPSSRVPGLVPTRQFYGIARRSLLPEHAVRVPPLGAALHALNPTSSRGDRAHRTSGHPLFADLYEAMGRLRCAVSKPMPRSTGCSRGAVVHTRVRRLRPRARRPQDLRRRHPLARSANSTQYAWSRSMRPFDLKAMETQDYDITRVRCAIASPRSRWIRSPTSSRRHVRRRS